MLHLKYFSLNGKLKLEKRGPDSSTPGSATECCGQ